MKSPERIGELMFRYLRNELTPEEEDELLEWRQSSVENEAFFQEETDPETIRVGLSEMYAQRDLIFKKITDKYPEITRKKKKKVRALIISIAAIFLITISIGFYFFLRSMTSTTTFRSVTTSQVNIKPGGNHAMLHLSNGKTIVLDSLKNGFLTTEGETEISKRDSGEIAYYSKTDSVEDDNRMNELSTPRGGQYALALSDGTRVWLNAASSIKFPTAFHGKERLVQLEGEGYFEVAKNPGIPFRVVTKNMEVNVTGTHFNVMAYGDEPEIQTTLLEGSVHVISTNDNGPRQEILLQPGQQADLLKGVFIIKKDFDMNAVIAWKNGKTSFKDAEIQSIMRVISRWYDVEVVYEGNIPAKRFNGGLPRNTNLTELLNVLEQNGIHTRLKGKIITVTP